MQHLPSQVKTHFLKPYNIFNNAHYFSKAAKKERIYTYTYYIHKERERENVCTQMTLKGTEKRKKIRINYKNFFCHSLFTGNNFIFIIIMCNDL